MLPPDTADRLSGRGHDAVTPARLGAHNLPDDVLIEVAAADNRVIVTENASDFAAVTSGPVLFVRETWCPTDTLSAKLADGIDRWGTANKQPGPWPHWLADDPR